MPIPIPLFTKKVKTKPNLYFFPTSYTHEKSIKCINFG